MSYHKTISEIAAVLMLAACSPVNTVPAPVEPSDPIQYYDLEIPASLQVQSIEFTATTFADVSGYGGNTGSPWNRNCSLFSTTMLQQWSCHSY